jgi:hypothetical protein
MLREGPFRLTAVVGFAYAYMVKGAISATALAPADFSSRRGFSIQIAQLAGTSGFSFSIPGEAGAQDETDKQKILQGYRRLNQLLDNWERETTVCGLTDNPYVGTSAFGKTGCERTPLKVMEYMGYRSVNDPLFKAEKTLRRLEILVPPDRETEYLEAVETWSEKADEASGMAYISSWGEANPGGGKDRIDYFIERAKRDVTEARDALGTIVSILQIE